MAPGRPAGISLLRDFSSVDWDWVRDRGPTLDRLEGSSKTTYHIPGYSGFIAKSQRNPLVVTMSNALEKRPDKSDLRLFLTHNLPGYTGHEPRAARRVRSRPVLFFAVLLRQTPNLPSPKCLLTPSCLYFPNRRS